jgi:hypothetical protein
MSAPEAVKLQTWAEDLRLPCFIDASITAPLLVELESLRRSSIPFQSKHLPALKRNIWYVLQRPRERSGLLCVWPAQKCCVYVSGEPPSGKRPTPRVAVLRLRMDPQFTESAGLTVFAATLSPTQRKVMVEDVYLWKGRNVFREQSFSARAQLARQWLEHYCILDTRLLGGLAVELAGWQPLGQMAPEGVWELQSDEAAQKRLLWIANQRNSPAPSPVLTAVPASTPVTCATLPVLDLTAPCVALAQKGASPDQWMLSSRDGIDLGRALIRTISISQELRLARAPIRVEVAWAANFGKWEILRPTSDHASPSGAFMAHQNTQTV